MEWILHLDTDELIHPAGTQEYSLRKLLLDVPMNVDMVVFPNYVSNTIHWDSIFLLVMPSKMCFLVLIVMVLVYYIFCSGKLCRA